MLQFSTKAVFLIGLLLTISCNRQIYDPNYQHSLFLGKLEKSVGRNFSEMRNRAGLAQDRALISETEQANGHIIYKYQYGRTCRYMLEVDPVTDIIVASNWEGEKRDCIIVP